MIIPKEIVEKMKQANALVSEINEWLEKQVGIEGTIYMLTKSPHSGDMYKFTRCSCGVEKDGVFWNPYRICADSFSADKYIPTCEGDFLKIHYEI